MRIKHGLTSWNLAVGRVGLCWRWNMPIRDALRAGGLRRYGGHGYATAGPLIVEW
jgi:hypothetical protein